MINTILGKIANVVEKEFLFGSFLPALLFLAAVAAAIGASMGVESALAMFENLGAARAAWMSAAAVIGVVVIAYVLSALRGSLNRMWSGDTALVRTTMWGLLKLGEAIQRARYHRLRRQSQAQSNWLDVLKKFEDDVAPHWSNALPAPCCWNRLLLKFHISVLRTRASEEAVINQSKKIAQSYERFNGNQLTNEFAVVKRQLLDWNEEDNFAVQARAAALDRGFGSLATVRATRLGNVIDSYNYYAYSRFCIEAELVWPRLQHVIPESYSKIVQDAKVLLDFAVTMCTLATLFCAFALLVGPWLINELQPWVIVAVVAALVARFFYLMSVDAAMQYGDLIRSSFDLFRLALLKQLGFMRPENLKAERDIWLQFSQLIVYGSKADLTIAPEKSA